MVSSGLDRREMGSSFGLREEGAGEREIERADYEMALQSNL